MLLSFFVAQEFFNIFIIFQPADHSVSFPFLLYSFLIDDVCTDWCPLSFSYNFRHVPIRREFFAVWLRVFFLLYSTIILKFIDFLCAPSAITTMRSLHCKMDDGKYVENVILCSSFSFLSCPLQSQIRRKTTQQPTEDRCTRNTNSPIFRI